MKKIKILVVALMVASFLGCSDKDDISDTIFDNVNGQTLISFASTTSDLPVVIGSTGTVDVLVEVSTISSSDRTVTVSIDTESTADAENYSLVSNVITIPANEYIGALTINGVDNSVDLETTTIILNIESTSVDSLLGTTTHTVNVFQVCPVSETFLVGNYLLTDNGNGNFGTDVPVTISVDPDDSTKRIFVATFLPATGVAADVDVVVTLACNLFSIGTIDINVSCDVDGPNSYIIGNAGISNNSSYDELVPETVGFVHTINYMEDIEADCGSALVQNFTLTKQ